MPLGQNGQPIVKPARTLVRSGQHRGGSTDATAATPVSNATLVKLPKGSARNSTQRRKEERHKQRRKGDTKRPSDAAAAAAAAASATTANERRRGKGKERKSRRQKSKGNKENASHSNINNSSSSHHRRNKDHKRKKDKNRVAASVTAEGTTERSRRSVETPTPMPEFCQHRLVDRCTWPQCNRVCPKLHNPFTGKQQLQLQLLDINMCPTSFD